MNDNKIVCANCELFNKETKRCTLSNEVIEKPHKIVCQAHQDWPYKLEGQRNLKGV